MFNMDPPRHDELRGILSRVLTPSRIAALEPHVRAYAEQLVDGFASTGAFDAATDFAQLIPTITMCALMDLPVAEQERFLKWNLDTLGGGDFTSPAALAAYGEMGAYWAGLVAERRGGEGTDLISQILHTEVAGEDLTDAEIGGFCSLLHDAAQNTTMNMIAHGVFTLGRYPDARDASGRNRVCGRRRSRSCCGTSPRCRASRARPRVTSCSTTSPSRRATRCCVLYGSANHDESVYPDPEVFDVDRGAPRPTGRSATASTTASATPSPASRSGPRCGCSSSARRLGRRRRARRARPARAHPWVASAPVSFSPASG